jgi:phage baseplate assembly protein W
MSEPAFRAFRFDHPVLDTDQPSVGLSLDLKGGVQMVDGAASVRQALMLLLSTSPGERLLRPGYGCDLYRLAFAVNDDTTAGLAVHYVRAAVQRWEPRVELLRVDAGRSERDPARLDLLVEYRVRRTLAEGRLDFSVPLQGEGS